MVVARKINLCLLNNLVNHASHFSGGKLALASLDLANFSIFHQELQNIKESVKISAHWSLTRWSENQSQSSEDANKAWAY